MTSDYFAVFNLILSFCTCSQSLKKSVRGKFSARTSLKETRNINLLSGTELTLYLGNKFLQSLHDIQTGINRSCDRAVTGSCSDPILNVFLCPVSSSRNGIRGGKRGHD